MNKKVFLIFLVFGFVVALLTIKLSPIFGKPLAEKYVRYNDVRGAAIEIEGKLYTLNFKQQNALVSKINQAVPFRENSHQKSAAKVILYRFNAPDLVFEVDAAWKNLFFLEPDGSRYLTAIYDLTYAQTFTDQ